MLHAVELVGFLRVLGSEDQFNETVENKHKLPLD